MTITIGKKQLAIVSAIAIILIIALVVSTGTGNAFTVDKAKEVAAKYVPSTAEFVKGEDEVSKYEIVFYDSTQKTTYEVEVRKDDRSVSKVQSQLDNDNGSSKVTLKEDDIEKVIKQRLPEVTSVSSVLTEDDGLYKYEAVFQADAYYGNGEIHPESGDILELTVKYGTATTIPSSGTSDSTYITSDKAEDIALAEAGGGIIKDIDLEKENGLYVYEVEVVNDSIEYTYIIDAETGKITLQSEHKNNITPTTGTGTIVSSGSETTGSSSSSSSSSSGSSSSSSGSSSTSQSGSTSSGTISSTQAKNIVLQKIPGATIYKLKLDYDDGRYVYEGEAYLGNYEYEFEINASSGVIIKWEKDYRD